MLLITETKLLKKHLHIFHTRINIFMKAIEAIHFLKNLDRKLKIFIKKNQEMKNLEIRMWTLIKPTFNSR